MGLSSPMILFWISPGRARRVQELVSVYIAKGYREYDDISRSCWSLVVRQLCFGGVGLVSRHSRTSPIKLVPGHVGVTLRPCCRVFPPTMGDKS
jgi:hypothetical protein